MSVVYLNDYGIVCSLGRDVGTVRDALMDPVDPVGLTATELFTPGKFFHLGLVPGELPEIMNMAAHFQSQNNRLGLLALQQIEPAVRQSIARYGKDRVAIVVGTSTSGQLEAEAARLQFERDGQWPATFDYKMQELGNLAVFLSTYLGTTGVAHVISTACSSSSKALASAARLLQSGMVDAVVAGGVDALNALTITGFSALESVSAERTNPLSINRSGISLGEGAALFLMNREGGPVRLAGWGETSDAHHMSAPDPTGRGARTAMELALKRAGVYPEQVDYINLHGTGTHHNDVMEAMAVSELCGPGVPVSSTKSLTGHTLGAAGAVEAAFACMTLMDNPSGILPPHWWDGQADPELAKLNVVAPAFSLGRSPGYVLSNSFAFGGSNASLLFGVGA
jgi:3-oxoacyl-[acyl-carrier-protein] synthase-1